MAEKRDSSANLTETEKELHVTEKQPKMESTEKPEENDDYDEQYDDGGGWDDENIYGKYECKSVLGLFSLVVWY